MDNEYLKQKPIKNKKIQYLVDEDNDQQVKIIIENNHKIQQIFRKLKFKIPEHTKIDMDVYTSFVFLESNGEQTINQIAQKLEKKYGDKVTPVNQRVGILFDFLVKKNLVKINIIKKGKNE